MILRHGNITSCFETCDPIGLSHLFGSFLSNEKHCNSYETVRGPTLLTPLFRQFLTKYSSIRVGKFRSTCFCFQKSNLVTSLFLLTRVGKEMAWDVLLVLACLVILGHRFEIASCEGLYYSTKQDMVLKCSAIYACISRFYWAII